MDWFGFFDKDTSTLSKDTIQPEMVEGELSGLNLKLALETHQAWRARLQKVLDGESNEKLDADFVSADSYCVLGKWIYGEGKKHYSHMPQYEFVRKAHAEFHVCAGEVLTQQQAGNVQDAETLLKTKFRTATNKNQMLLTSLFTAVKGR